MKMRIFSAVPFKREKMNFKKVESGFSEDGLVPQLLKANTGGFPLLEKATSSCGDSSVSKC